MTIVIDQPRNMLLPAAQAVATLLDDVSGAAVVALVPCANANAGDPAHIQTITVTLGAMARACTDNLPAQAALFALCRAVVEFGRVSRELQDEAAAPGTYGAADLADLHREMAGAGRLLVALIANPSACRG